MHTQPVNKPVDLELGGHISHKLVAGLNPYPSLQMHPFKAES